MSNVDPYAAPNATSGVATHDFYQPKIFSLSGRIGRLRYLAYSMVIQLILFGAMIALSMISGVLSALSSSVGIGIGVIGMVIVVIVALVFGIAIAVRRINDFNKSGWMSLLLIIPLVGTVMALVLLFMPGSQGDNNYGAAPAPNSTGVIIGALCVPVVIVLFGILAAIAIPAYQGYVERAQAAEATQFDFDE